MAGGIGLIGTGLIARFHAAGLAAAGERIVAVADVDEGAGRRFAAEIGSEYAGEYRRLLDDRRVGAVIVATPNHTHHRLAVDALAAGKDVLCEKPMTTTPEDSADLVAKARARPGQLFQVGYMKRCNAGFRLLRDLLPELGELVSAHVRVIAESRPGGGEQWYRQPERSGGGVLTHSGSHLLDVTRWLFGEPVRVDARVQERPGAAGLDWATTGLLDMENGATVYFSTLAVPISRLGHTQQGWEETIEVIGTRGRAHLSSPNWQGTLPCVVTLQLDEERQVRTIYPEPTSQWETQARLFLERRETRQPGAPDAVDGYKVDELIGCVRESGRRRAPVEVRWRL